MPRCVHAQVRYTVVCLCVCVIQSHTVVLNLASSHAAASGHFTWPMLCYPGFTFRVNCSALENAKF